MLNQQTKGLNRDIAKEGCKYLCHARIAEYESSNIMSINMINGDYVDHVKYKWLTENSKTKIVASVSKPNEIMADFIQDLGGTGPFVRQIGRNPGDGIYHFWGGKQTKPIKYHLVEFKTDNGYHWVLFDGLFNELYDPWTLVYNRKHIHSINLIG